MIANPSDSDRAPRLLLLLGALVCSGWFAAEIFLLSRPGFPLDDSWIHLQFARNLAAGGGLAYNPGEIVTGSTAPLWTALLALLFYLPGNLLLWVKLLGAAFHLAGVDATRRLAGELGLPRGLALLAGGLTLATPPLVWSALSGMEVPLFVWLSLWGLILHARERRTPERVPLSLGVFALAVLARPEGALLLVLAGADRLLFWPRGRLLAAALQGLVLAGCAAAGYALFSLYASGSVLPTTFAVKGSGVQRWLPSLQYLYVILGIFFRSQPWPALLATGGAFALLVRLGTPRDRGLLPALWLFGLPLAYSLMSPLGPGLIAGNFGRYYFPLLPVLILLAVLALEPLLAAPRGIRGLCFAALLAPSLVLLVEGAKRYTQNVANVEDSDVAMAHWLAARLPAEAVLAVNDIGALKFLLPNRVIDLVGISSPDVRREAAEGTRRGLSWSQAMLEALERRRPDYLVIFPTWFPALDADPRFSAVYRLRIPDNVTMGGDEVVVYTTPWTRHPLR